MTNLIINYNNFSHNTLKSSIKLTLWTTILTQDVRTPTIS